MKKSKHIKTLTIKTKEGDIEYVAQIGNIVEDRVGRPIGFEANETSPNLTTQSRLDKWITNAIQ